MQQHLALGLGHRLPILLQSEAAECGLACLGMVAGYYGHHVDLLSLRNRYPMSLKGATLSHLIHIADQMRLAPRALRLDLDEMNQLRCPCILHWKFNHFVVLKKVTKTHLIIHDPASGRRKVKLEEASKQFTGVALELWPMTDFEKKNDRQDVKITALIGRLQGLWSSLAQIIILALCIEVFSLVAPFYLQWVIDQVIVSYDESLLLTLAIGFGLIMLLKELVTALRGYVLLYLSTTLNVQWLSNVFSHLLNLPVQYFEKRHVGDVVSRFRAVDEIQQTLTASFFSAVLDGIMSIAVLVMMFLYSPKLAGIAITVMLSYFLLRLIWYRPLKQATEAQIIHEASQHSHFLETVRGIKTIKLFNQQTLRRSRWQSLFVEQVNAGLRTQKLNLFYQLANGILFGIEHILIIYFGAQMVLAGNFSVGALMAFISYKSMFDTRVATLIENYFALKMLRIQTERLSDIVLTATEKQPLTLLEPTTPAGAMSIELKDVHFRYSEQEPWVLKGVSFVIHAGENIAITGASGGGKTTLVNIILGILTPQSGQILVDGKPVGQEDLIKMRSRVGTVMQDDVLFAGSVGDNISFFDTDLDEEKMQTSAKMACIHEDIEAMPMAYHTLVGDMGTVLSGGQKQRVLLARAIYRQPDLLCLDEATSHLDVTREQVVNEAIKTLSATRVVIAHRPDTIRTSDRVLVLEQGVIVRDIPASEY